MWGDNRTQASDKPRQSRREPCPGTTLSCGHHDKKVIETQCPRLGKLPAWSPNPEKRRVAWKLVSKWAGVHPQFHSLLVRNKPKRRVFIINVALSTDTLTDYFSQMVNIWLTVMLLIVAQILLSRLFWWMMMDGHSQLT